LRLVVDTGAGPTIIVPELLDELGYSARQHGEQVGAKIGPRWRLDTRRDSLEAA
jgi:hypothetical protein